MAFTYQPCIPLQAGVLGTANDPNDAVTPVKKVLIPAMTLVDQAGNAAGSGTAASPTFTAAANPATILSGQVKIATTGTAVQLPSNALVNGISIFANPANAAAIVVGPSGVPNITDGTGSGDVIQKGGARSFAVSNSNAIYVNGTAGDWISWSGN